MLSSPLSRPVGYPILLTFLSPEIVRKDAASVDNKDYFARQMVQCCRVSTPAVRSMVSVSTPTNGLEWVDVSAILAYAGSVSATVIRGFLELLLRLLGRNFKSLCYL